MTIDGRSGPTRQQLLTQRPVMQQLVQLLVLLFMDPIDNRSYPRPAEMFCLPLGLPLPPLHLVVGQLFGGVHQIQQLLLAYVSEI